MSNGSLIIGQIKRTCEFLDYKVTNLKRIRIININPDDLETGKWWVLTPIEIQKS
jgi:16S rRNA U516 pseudouridylate synthase RsuA-like enzyme